MTFQQLNSKIIQTPVNPSSSILARRGAMLGYRGTVGFRPVTGQGQNFGGKAAALMSRESNAMMEAEGNGEILYGYKGLYATIINLDGTHPFTVEADRLLAYEKKLTTKISFLGKDGLKAAMSGAMTGQGLFTTLIEGQGDLAILSHGGTFPIKITGNTIGVDPQAYVGHKGNLNVSLKAKAGFKDIIGRGSGEAFQLHITGQGTVYVQASEQKF